MNTRLAVLALATAALAACEPNPSVTGPAAALQAARDADVSAAVSDPGAVYTLTNQVGGNAVAVFARGADGRLTAAGTVSTGGTRSEEHTSELQSRLHLVCRLLLEKKKKITRCTNLCD